MPRNVYAKMVERQASRDTTVPVNFAKLYDEAAEICKAKVARIREECRKTNEKYSDPYFDLHQTEDCVTPLYGPKDTAPRSAWMPGGRDSEFVLLQNNAPCGKLEIHGLDLRPGGRNNEFGLVQNNIPYGRVRLWEPRPQEKAPPEPQSVKRIGDIFESPQFFVEGPSAQDIRQGIGDVGDCWLLSAMASLCDLEPSNDLIEKVCVDRDEEVGVYGFVFYRDGEWITEIVDDKLYLLNNDYEERRDILRKVWESARTRVDSAEDYRKEFQSNSSALYYAQSTHKDETWVPLLEKAFAKAHGDYESIDEGCTG